jgi:hypothetical protein
LEGLLIPLHACEVLFPPIKKKTTVEIILENGE